MGLWSLLGGVSGLLQAPLTRGPRLFLKGLLLVSSQTGVLAPSGSDADGGNVVLGARGVKGACCWSVSPWNIWRGPKTLRSVLFW